MGLVQFLKDNADLSGWAQFAGTMIALFLTYWMALHPLRHRKKQLENSAKRLLLNGYESFESFHRTSEHLHLQAINLRAAGLTMTEVASEIDRFPLFELEDQGSRSLARSLVAVSRLLRLSELFLQDMAQDLGASAMTEDEREDLRTFLAGQMQLVEDILSGAPLQRPDPPVR